MLTNEFTIHPNPSPVRIPASSYHTPETVYAIGAVTKSEAASDESN